jgi:uncharacterized protein DUF2798
MARTVTFWKLPKRHAHFLFAVIQSGLTTAVASAITSLRLAAGDFFSSWLTAWLVSWVTMVPVVLLAAPLIRRLTHLLTHGEH